MLVLNRILRTQSRILGSVLAILLLKAMQSQERLPQLASVELVEFQNAAGVFEKIVAVSNHVWHFAMLIGMARSATTIARWILRSDCVKCRSIPVAAILTIIGSMLSWHADGLLRASGTVLRLIGVFIRICQSNCDGVNTREVRSLRMLGDVPASPDSELPRTQ